MRVESKISGGLGLTMFESGKRPVIGLSTIHRIITLCTL